MATKKETTVAAPPPTEEAAVAVINNEALAALYAEDAGQQDFGKDDLAIPFIRALQDGSPQVKEREPKYIPGAKAGMIFNTVTGQLWPSETEPMIIIPVCYTPSFTEWKPNRGGFANDHGDDESIMAKTKKGGKDGREDVLPNGNTVQRSGLYYIFIVDEATGDLVEAAFALSSTGLTISRKWNTNMRQLRVPGPGGTKINPVTFAYSYKLSTFLDREHAAGEFFSYRIELYKPTVELKNGQDLYLAARGFKKMVSEGVVKVKPEQEPNDSKDVPF